MAQIDIQVPDIGDFDEVAVIELLVNMGDTVSVDQSLITVESDKASMEIPSSHAGVVTALKVKLGDKVKQGSVVLTVEASIASAVSAAEPASPAPTSAAATRKTAAASTASTQSTPAANSTSSSASSYSGAVDVQCDLLVLGGGPGGYSAAFRAADLGLNVVLVERYAQLGGVCLNVGCIPSKALLHVAAVIDEASHLSSMGVEFGKAKINLDGLRGYKEKVINKLTGGLAAMAKMRKVTVLRGYGVFVGSHHLVVEKPQARRKRKPASTKWWVLKTASSPQAAKLCICHSCRTIRAWLTAQARCNWPKCPNACWCWAAASLVSRWARFTAHWAHAWMLLK